jgi:hypothetical protein
MRVQPADAMKQACAIMDYMRVHAMKSRDEKASADVGMDQRAHLGLGLWLECRSILVGAHIASRRFDHEGATPSICTVIFCPCRDFSI